MGVSDKVCRECLRIHDGCPANSVETCVQLDARCGGCAYKAPGRFTGMDGTPGLPEGIHGCEKREPFVGVQDRTRACGHYRPTR